MMKTGLLFLGHQGLGKEEESMDEEWDCTACLEEQLHGGELDDQTYGCRTQEH